MPSSSVTNAWEAAVDTLADHVKIGRDLQRQGLKMLKEMEEGGLVKNARLMKEGRGLVRDGIRIESNAKMSIYRMERNKP